MGKKETTETTERKGSSKEAKCTAILLSCSLPLLLSVLLALLFLLINGKLPPHPPAPTETETSVDPDNLFNTSFEVGGIGIAGEDTEENDRVRSGYIPVSPATIYTLSVTDWGYPFYTSLIYEYDAEFRFLHRVPFSNSVSPATFATSADTAYLRVQSGRNAVATVENAVAAGFYLEEGTVSTPWNSTIPADCTADLAVSDGMQYALDRLRIFSDTILETRGNGFAIGYNDPVRIGKPHPYTSLHLKKDSLLFAFPYSSVRKTDAYVGMEVSLETFFSALANPASILYTSDISRKDDPGHSPGIQYAWSPYGAVCSTIIGYAFNFDIRYSTYEWANIPGMNPVNPLEDGLMLCDVLCSGTPDMQDGGHMAIVSRILRHNNGKIYAVEVTEASIACIRKTWLTYPVFEELYLSRYQVYRYDRLGEVPPADRYPTNAELNRMALCPDRGNGAVYPQGATVTLNLMQADGGEIVIRYAESAEGTYRWIGTLNPADAVPTDVNGISCNLLAYVPDTCGFYRLSVRSADGTESESATFSVADPGSIAYRGGGDRLTIRTGETFEVEFSGYDGCKPLYICMETRLYVTRIQRFLSTEEIADGTASFSSDQAGEMYLKIYFENEYGKIVSKRLLLTVTED